VEKAGLRFLALSEDEMDLVDRGDPLLQVMGMK
jgi:hypothetical protein